MKPEEDLILEGSERTIIRVQAGTLIFDAEIVTIVFTFLLTLPVGWWLSGTAYSCLMLKTQRFSSLFRHYAKHHGLKKVFLFVAPQTV